MLLLARTLVQGRDNEPGEDHRAYSVGAGVGWMWGGDACVARSSPTRTIRANSHERATQASPLIRIVHPRPYNFYYIRSASLGVTLPACHAGNMAASSEASRAMPTIRPSSLHGTLKTRPVWNCSKKSTAKMFCERIRPRMTPSTLPTQSTKNDSLRKAA